MGDKETLTGVVLAAGEGRRMRPLTELYPKPALPVLGTASFEVIAEKILRAGASDIHCNLFHLPHHLIELIGEREWPVTAHLEETLLGTGGGIGNMADALQSSSAIIVHNGDIISNIELEPVIASHLSRGSLFTMVLCSKGPPASVCLDAKGDVTSIGSPERGEVPRLGYTGISVLSPDALGFFPRGDHAELVPILKRMMAERPGSVAGFEAAADTLWAEIGSLRGYHSLHRRILVEKEAFDPMLEPPALPLHISGGAIVDPGSRWGGFLSVQAGAHIERDTTLDDCIVLEGARVAEGECHADSIIYRKGAIKVER
jgi:mannose-1-phosphate guanylyltransferase